MPDLDMIIDEHLRGDSPEDCNWEPEYRCPNCDSMYDGYYCPCCGYNTYNGGM